MSRKHRDRLRALAPFAIPEPNDPERAAFEAAVDKAVPRDRAKGFAKGQWRKTVALTSAQATNGAALVADATLRDFLTEYNSRVMRYGLNSMPSSFNGLEAFYEYQPPLICFRLLEERDHEFSWSHFIDYVTSEAPTLEHAVALEAMPEGTILSFSNTEDPSTMLFAGPSGRAFGPASFSMVRHGNEVTVVFTGGQDAEFEAASSEIKEAVGGGRGSRRPYLDKLDVPTEAVPLEGASLLWRLVAAARFDMDVHTENARYVLQDMGDSFLVETDDVKVFLDAHGEFVSREARAAAESSSERLAEFTALFDLCATALHLPTYFETYAESIVAERRETAYRTEIKEVSASLLKRWIPARERIPFRTVQRLAPAEQPLRVPERTFAPPDFRIEASGYWRKVEPGVMGADRDGQPIEGKTWVIKRLTWLEGQDSSDALASSTTPLPHGPDPGWIYVMRTVMHPLNVFKVGLTRRTPDLRARELSGTGSPDKFLVVHQWPTPDCAAAEREIHSRIKSTRVSEDREFFEMPLRDLVAVINDVLDQDLDR